MVTVNQAAKLDIYPLPHANDLFASLAGGKMFITLDLAHAYQQIPLDEGSKSHHHHSQRPLRLQLCTFGVSSTQWRISYTESSKGRST